MREIYHGANVPPLGVIHRYASEPAKTEIAQRCLRLSAKLSANLAGAQCLPSEGTIHPYPRFWTNTIRVIAYPNVRASRGRMGRGRRAANPDDFVLWTKNIPPTQTITRTEGGMTQ